MNQSEIILKPILFDEMNKNEDIDENDTIKAQIVHPVQYTTWTDMWPTLSYFLGIFVNVSMVYMLNHRRKYGLRSKLAWLYPVVDFCLPHTNPHSPWSQTIESFLEQS